MLLCVLLAVPVLCVLGDTQGKFGRRNKERISDLQLLVPIEYLQSERDDSESARAGRFSRIPADQFVLDDPQLLFGAKSSVKKDLSRPHASAPARELPTDLAEDCLIYLHQTDPSEKSDVAERTRSTLENRLLNSLCKKFISTLYLDRNPDEDAARNLYAGNVGLNGVGGLAGNVGVNGRGGIGPHVGAGGRGGNFQFREYENAPEVSAIDDAVANGVIANIFKGLGIGNMGTGGRGSYAGNIALDGLGESTGNVGVGGFGGVAGNAAFHGMGKKAGNVGVNGKGGHTGNLGVGGTGGLFGNLAIGGQGGFYGNVGIGTEGNQYVDLYTGNQDLMNYVFGKKIPQNPSQYYSYSHTLKQKRKDVQKSNEIAPTSSTLDQVPIGLVAPDAQIIEKPLEHPETIILPPAEGTSNSNAESVVGGEQKDAEGDSKAGKESGDDKGVARDSSGAAGCAVGALAAHGRGGAVGNLALGGRCQPCLHVYYLAPGATNSPPLVQKAPAHAELDRFRPLAGRRGWMVLDGQLDGKLRQYVNSKKPWLVL